MIGILETLNYSTRGKLLFSFAPVTGVELKKRFLQSSAYFQTKVNNNNENQSKQNKQFAGALAVGLLASSAGAYYYFKNKVDINEKFEIPKEDVKSGVGHLVKNLPTYTESDVAKHISKENKIWVTYKNGVYDVTDFIEQHPGGDKILLAAGSSLEPFWSLYAVHHTPEVYNMLEEHRIGNLKVSNTKPDLSSDPYANDPKRHPVLKPASLKPFNAEPLASLLVENFYTPNQIFFVRNHLPVPEVDISKYSLVIKGIGVKEKSLTMEEIKKFPKHTVTATLQCAGNRRSEMSDIKAVKGLTWNHGAIGNATWTGARLTDVLKFCGLDLERKDVQHIQFEGLDKGPDNVSYGASIPSEKALDSRGDVILAYEMNGEPISRDHGYPLRVVAPGIVGARNVKWLSKIIISDKESDSHWQQNDYKGFSPSIDWDNVDFKTSPAIQELPVISAICSPEEGEKVVVKDGAVVVKGYAWSGGGRKIVRVDVTADKGKTWHGAKLNQSEDKHPRHWGWTLWTATIPVPEKQGSVEIWAKAVDSSYNTQPETVENIWNLRGVLCNAYHKVKINVSKV